MRSLAVVGKFDTDGGRPSKIGGAIAKHLQWPHINGGHVDILKQLNASYFDVILWMPDIPNDSPKFLPRLKAANRKLLLISSKQCRGEYSDADVVGLLLKSKSNLGIAISGDKAGYSFKLLDPLGNFFIDTTSISALSSALTARVLELSLITRYMSHSVGPRRHISVDKKFLDVVRRYGKEFANYINALNVNRYLGNAATRCAFGFPASRSDGIVLVSRRNVPKDEITSDDFVEIEQQGDRIYFWGGQKPSVDAPVQALLFSHYENINFMIHGHVYVKRAVITDAKLPCGAIQESSEIIRLIPKRSSAFTVNLRGHGCLMACNDLSYFDSAKLEPRPFPES